MGMGRNSLLLTGQKSLGAVRGDFDESLRSGPARICLQLDDRIGLGQGGDGRLATGGATSKGQVGTYARGRAVLGRIGWLDKQPQQDPLMPIAIEDADRGLVVRAHPEHDAGAAS